MQKLFGSALVIVTIFSTHHMAFAQADSVRHAHVAAYAKHLDNLRLGMIIEEGIIRKNGKNRGGFGIYTRFIGDTVLVIKYHDNTRLNNYRTYYYRSDALISSIFELQDAAGTGKAFYRREEYYMAGAASGTVVKLDKLPGRYSSMTKLSLLDEGKRLLADSKKSLSGR